MKRSSALADYVRCGFLIVYIGSYLLLSSFGTYTYVRATSVFAMIRVDWAPLGFVVYDNWNFAMHFVYLPLYALDQTFWHTETRRPNIATRLDYASSSARPPLDTPHKSP